MNTPLVQIIEIRNQQVIVDSDLAALYGSTTKKLNQAVKRNIKRFPEDFAFRLTSSEKDWVVTNCDHLEKLKFSSTPPRVFTVFGALQASNVLSSPRAIKMSVAVVRAFVDVSYRLAETTKRLEISLKSQGYTNQEITEILDPILALAPKK